MEETVTSYAVVLPALLAAAWFGIPDYHQGQGRPGVDYAGSGFLVPVSINLAARNVGDEGLINTLIEGLQKSSMPTASIEVEVTESALMRDPETTTRQMSQ